MTDWSRQLDRIEGQLNRQAAAIASGDVPEVLELETPTVAMTVAERARATVLLQRSDDLLYHLLDQVRGRRPEPASPYGR